MLLNQHHIYKIINNSIVKNEFYQKTKTLVINFASLFFKFYQNNKHKSPKRLKYAHYQQKNTTKNGADCHNFILC